MSEISIDRAHKLGRTEAHKRLNDLEPKLKDKYGVKLEWKGDSAQLKGTGVTGSIDIGDANVSVHLKLGLLLRPMAGKIREALESQIERALA